MKTSQPLTSSERIHSLDALRAVLMFLGIVIHTAAAYMVEPIPPTIWPFQDSEKWIGFDLLVVFIHSFRMPLFFFLAGFFARMVYTRRGAAGFLRHRLLRLGLPFLLFLPPSFAFARYILAQTHPNLSPPALLTVHLWFLYYLLAYSLAFAAAGHWPGLDTAFARFWASPWRWPVLIAATAFFLQRQAMAGFDPDMKLLPNLQIVLAYALLYGTGWLLYPIRDGIYSWQRHCLKFTSAAFVLQLLYLPLAIQLADQYAKQPTPHIVESLIPPEPLHTVATLVAAAMTWLFIAAAMGLFLRYAQQASPLARYLAGAAYWVYLVHLFPVLYLPWQLSQWKAGPLLKFSITVLGTAALCLGSYELLIRRRPWGWLFGAPSPAAYESASHSR